MAQGIYDKWFFKNPIKPGRHADRLVFYARNYVGEKDFSVTWNCITEPFLMVNDPHSHDFDQFLHFYSGDSLHVNDFQAEVEMTVGEEMEKHVITETTVLYLPAGTLHCPLNFKEIRKPIVFMNVALTPEYMRADLPH
jgi:hypothetical protein